MVWVWMWMPSTASTRRRDVGTLQRCLPSPQSWHCRQHKGRERRLMDGDQLHLRHLRVAELELEQHFNIVEEKKAPQPCTLENPTIPPCST
ncbi:hypothetical protein AAZX31_14G113300 [Glycine max]